MTVDGSDGLTIVLPALNEEGGIAITLQAVNQMRERLTIPSEVIVVNDGSTDRTAEVAGEHEAHVISHPKPGGYGRALKTGIRAARYPLVAIADADGTYPVDEIPAMVEQMTDVNVVIGTRTGPNYMRHVLTSPLRTTFLVLTNFVTGEWISDPNSGMRIFRKCDVLPILHRLPNAFSFTTTHTLIATLDHQFVAFRPIPYGKRLGRSKVRPLRDALRVGQTLFEVMLRYNPLKPFVLMTALLAAVALPFLVFGEGLGGVAGLFLISTALIVFALGMATVAIAGGAPSTDKALPSQQDHNVDRAESDTQPDDGG